MPDIRIPSFNDFSTKILKGDLRLCLRAVSKYRGNEDAIFQSWADEFFGGVRNKRSSTNIPVTLKSTGLTTGGKPIELSSVGRQVLAAPSKDEAAKIFCKHLLENKNGKLLIKALSNLRQRGDKATKKALKAELARLGVVGLSNGTTDHTTMKNWFKQAGLVKDDGTPNDSELKKIVGISSAEIDAFDSLSLAQQVFIHFLKKESMLSPGPYFVKDLLKSCIQEYPHLFDEAQFANQIRKPLEEAGWIRASGLASGVHGGRSGSVFIEPMLANIPVEHIFPDFNQIIPSEVRSKINTPLAEILDDLYSSNKHKAGLALELLALRMIVDLGLEPRSFRKRSPQTGYAEVDLIAEATHLLFSRWTFQCKRYGKESNVKVGLSEVAKEVGIAIYTKSHVIVMVTTTDFTADARKYADEVTRSTHLQFVFVSGKEISNYLKKGRQSLWAYFISNANKIMKAKKEQEVS